MARIAEIVSGKALSKKQRKVSQGAFAQKSFTRLFYKGNLIALDAFELAKISVGRKLASYEPMGVLDMTIQNFDAKLLHRNIRERAYSKLLDDVIPATMSGYHDKAHEQPAWPAYTMPTRWDMNGGVFIKHQPTATGDPAPPQRVLIKITIIDPLLDFLEDIPAITAKDAESQKVLANLEVSPPGQGPRTARFWLLYEGGSAPPVVAGFNIALLVKDREDSTFSVPIIVDPKIPNRG